MAAEPKWRRRGAERPAEIAQAALAVFAERGYAAARMADIATRAGVSKAALFVYYPTKADLFRAVLASRMSPNIEAVIAAAFESRPLPAILRAVLARLAMIFSIADVRKLGRMVIAESGNFPELAKLWHDQVVAPALGALASAIAAAQDRGECRPGDPRLIAITVIGPMLGGLIWSEVMEPAGGAPIDLVALAAEHLDTLSAGLLARDPAGSGDHFL